MAADYSRLSFEALERHEIWRIEQSRIFKEVRLAAQIVNEVTGTGTIDPSADVNATEDYDQQGDLPSRSSPPRRAADLIGESGEVGIVIYCILAFLTKLAYFFSGGSSSRSCINSINLWYAHAGGGYTE